MNVLQLISDGIVSNMMIELVDKVLMEKENSKADTSQLEIDQLVYKLYNLILEEIKIIEDSVK